jgi:hypothetical protein
MTDALPSAPLHALVGRIIPRNNIMTNELASVNFFIHGKDAQFARRTMAHVPRAGDVCVFKNIRYPVVRIEWCMDEDATACGIIRVNVELSEGQ